MGMAIVMLIGTTVLVMAMVMVAISYEEQGYGSSVSVLV